MLLCDHVHVTVCDLPLGSHLQYCIPTLPDCSVSADIAVVVYAVGIMEGNEEVWDYVWDQSRKTRVASEAEVMMNALAYTQEPWLLWR